MGKRRLKAAMPRCYADHRTADAKRLRRVYDDLASRFKDLDGVARRVALLAAESWMAYEDLGIEIERASGKRKSTLSLSRLRRRRQSAAGQFLGGLRSLEALTGGNGDGRGLDLAAMLAHQGLET